MLGHSQGGREYFGGERALRDFAVEEAGASESCSGAGGGVVQGNQRLTASEGRKAQMDLRSSYEAVDKSAAGWEE